MLKFLKILHTAIWVIMATSNFVAFYLAFVGNFGFWFWVSAGLIILECVIIVAFAWKCPITYVAEKYATDRRANFDIYLPHLLAKYNVKIFSVLIVLEIVIVLIKNLFN